MRLPLISAVCVLLTSTLAGERPPFFAFTYGFKDRPVTETVSWLAENGYAGVGANVWNEVLFDQLEAIYATSEVKTGDFRVFGVYFPMEVTNPQHRKLAHRVIARGATHGTPLWLAIKAEGATERNVVVLIQELADRAAREGTYIVLYPHDRHFMLTAERSLELITAADRPNVFTSLHYHQEMRAGNHDRMDEIVRQAVPHTRLASISATNPPDQIQQGSRDWSDVVQPLANNPEPVLTFMDLLTAHGYTGPIGYQNFGIPGNPEQHHIESLTIFTKGSGRDL